MITGRRHSDWLDRSPQGGDERQGERREADRRAPRRRLDPLFAATLVNQDRAGRERISRRAIQQTAKQLRRGVVVNVRA